MAQDQAHSAPFTNLSVLLDRPELSDITVISGSYDVRAHRAVFALRSPVLDQICNKTSIFNMNGERELDLGRHSEDTVERLILYLYTFNYPEIFEYDNSEEHEVQDMRMRSHARMCVVADDYEMEDLRELAVKRFTPYMQLPASLGGLNETIEALYNRITFPISQFPATEMIRRRLVHAIAHEEDTFLRDIDDEQLQNIIDRYDTLPRSIAEVQYRRLQSDYRPLQEKVKANKNEFLSGIHPLYPFVVKIGDKWKTVSCRICGANAGSRGFFSGVGGVQKHVQDVHGGEAFIDERGKWCQVYTPSARDIGKMKRGICLIRPFVGVPKSEWKMFGQRRLLKSLGSKMEEI